MNKKTDFKGFCFSKGTEVLLSKRKTKYIENIKVGDEILNYNVENNTVETEIVEKIVASMHSVINIIEFSNDIKVESTTDHPYFIVGKGWCSVNPKATNENYGLNVGEIAVGDKCLHFTNDKLAETTIIGIDAKVKDSKMYVISGGKNNNFFANGIVVSDENIMALNLKEIDIEVETLAL